MKKAFTLVELTIVLVIMSILIGIIFEVFIMIAHIAVKVKNERALHDEVIYLTQTIQNILDRGDTVFFGDSAESDDGYQNALNLSGTLQTYSYVLSGDVVQLVTFDSAFTNIYGLTDTTRIIVNNFYIKRVPYRSQAVYENTMHEGFWLFLDVQTPSYDPDKWWQRVDRKLQTFFNVRTYD